MYVYDQGIANFTTVNSGGYLYVSSGGTATGIVENGGYVYVADGAEVTFTPNAFSGLVLSNWQSATVHSGTTAVNTTLSSGCLMRVYEGGTVNSITINLDGQLSAGAVGAGASYAIAEM